jgi:hypothetical protein
MHAHTLPSQYALLPGAHGGQSSTMHMPLPVELDDDDVVDVLALEDALDVCDPGPDVDPVVAFEPDPVAPAPP